MGMSLQRIRSAVLAVIAAAAVQPIFAATLDDYQRRVDSARSGVNVLLSNVALEEAGEEAGQPNGEVFAALFNLLPPSEKIETSAGTVETANQWFQDGIAEAQKEDDLTKRAELLTELEQRLSALNQSLNELKIASGADRSKDEDKQKLAEILNRPEYQKPPKEENSGSGDWIRWFLEWLESLFPKFEPSTNPISGFGSIAAVIQWLVIFAIIILLGFLAYKLAPIFAPRFRQKKGKEKTERVILGEKIEDDVSANDLFSEAERLAREGDVRGAIRKGYVALLCELSDRKIIGLARHKTNRDYLRDVRGRDIYQQMNGLTGTFERHWYGSQSARSQDWDEFRRSCGETLKAI